MTRIGQGKFRNRLLEKFNRCIICGIENKNLLIASHIKPWNKCNNKEKIDIENGFILCPNHDKLFDRGFITLNNKGEILTSRSIEKDISKLNIKNILLYSLSGENRKYLEWHREKIFNKSFSKIDIVSQNNNFY